MTDETYAEYLRGSTDTQEVTHQQEDNEQWCRDHDIDPDETVEFVDLDVSGAERDRPGLDDLLDRIRADEIDHVIVWEISRIGRRGSIIQEFLDACADHDVVVHITNGKVERIKPDGTNRFVADIVGMVYSEERRQLIRRTKSGLRRARREGKWLGSVPTGFVRTDDGYLKPNLSPDYDEDETGYLDVVDALEAVESGESYRAAARSLPNASRQTLMNIHKSDRAAWYLDTEADDPAVDEALDEIRDNASGGES